LTGDTGELQRSPAERTDFTDANRGLVARLEPGVIHGAGGRVVYDASRPLPIPTTQPIRHIKASRLRTVL